MYGKTRRASGEQGNTLLGVLLGLLIGALIAVGVAVYVNLGPKPFVAKQDAQSSHDAPLLTQSTPIALPGKPGEAPVKPSVSAQTSSSQSSNPQPQAQAQASQPVEKPKYDFYQTLPRGDSASVPVVEKPAPSAQPDKVYLQAGSYQNPSEADNLKARLALMGIEANVQRVDLGDKGVFYRVRLGSFPNGDAAETMRARLATEGIAANVVKLKADKQ